MVHSSAPWAELVALAGAMFLLPMLLPRQSGHSASSLEPNPALTAPQQRLGARSSWSSSEGSLLRCGTLEKHSLCKRIARKHWSLSLAGKTRSLWDSPCAQQNNEAHSFLLSLPQLLSATKPAKFAWLLPVDFLPHILSSSSSKTIHVPALDDLKAGRRGMTPAGMLTALLSLGDTQTRQTLSGLFSSLAVTSFPRRFRWSGVIFTLLPSF